MKERSVTRKYPKTEFKLLFSEAENRIRIRIRKFEASDEDMEQVKNVPLKKIEDGN